MSLTERRVACLAYLDNKMEANATMIGEAIIEAVGTGKHPNPDRSPGRLGGVVASQLRALGLVTRIPELRAYRITAAGREELKKSKLGADPK